MVREAVVHAEFKDITFDESQSLLAGDSDYKQAVHCSLYALDWKETIVKLFAPKAAMMMQLRCDGFLGFPGGYVDPGEDPVTACNRELREEVGLETDKYSVTQADWVSSDVAHSQKFISHFYALKVNYNDFQQIEQNSLSQGDWGHEVFGVMRVPLFSWPDNYKGLGAFLDNNFIGNAKQQLVTTVRKLKILDEDEISKALGHSNGSKLL